MKRVLLFAVLTLVGTASTAFADSQFAGIYSNMRYVEEAGDLIGDELMIVPQPSGGGRYSVLVQCNDGSLGETVFVPAVAKGDQISFDVPQLSNCPGHYAGRLTTAKTKEGTESFLTFDRGMSNSDSGRPLRLKNKRSYWDGG